MRLRKVKGAEEIVQNSDYVIKEPIMNKGRYKELFGNNNPIHLEIGVGKGKFIVEKALNCPDINFVGIEKYDSVLIRALEKVKDVKIPNLLFINDDASNVDAFFDREIDTLYLNFSDPWPKNRHEKRRLTSEKFLNKYELIFKKNPHIIMKTDNRKFFEYSLKSLVDKEYKIEKISLDLHEDNYPDNIMTEYEEKFGSKGSVIYMVEVIKE